MNGIPILKSGVDFRYLTQVKISQGEEGVVFEILQHPINKQVPSDEQVEHIVDKYDKVLVQKMSKVIACNARVLDATSDTLRSKESNIANFICDLVNEELATDVTLLAVGSFNYFRCKHFSFSEIKGGTFRSDSILEQQEFTLGDLLQLLPFEDIMVTIKLSGQKLWEALENGVSALPGRDGRFPQVAGMSFIFSPKAEKGCRIKSVLVKGEALDRNKIYSVATVGTIIFSF